MKERPLWARMYGMCWTTYIDYNFVDSYLRNRIKGFSDSTMCNAIEWYYDSTFDAPSGMRLIQVYYEYLNHLKSKENDESTRTAFKHAYNASCADIDTLYFEALEVDDRCTETAKQHAVDEVWDLICMSCKFNDENLNTEMFEKLYEYAKHEYGFDRKPTSQKG
ncbi:hypothetical protein EOL73_00240 [Candidatus Saccharibacteria bacterium]|nr:hypothetical protein [Candidatus Saccharibacteria bacterium]